MKKILYADTETTGLDPKIHDIVQLAVIIEIDGKVKEKLQWFVQPFNWKDINAEALKINGFTIEQLKTFTEPIAVYRNLILIFDKYIDRYNKNDKFGLAGYNGQFDRRMLNEFFLKNGDKYFGSYVDYHILDPASLLYLLEYKGALRLKDYHLETACKYFNIEIKAHDAMEDIIATRKLTHKLLEYIK